MKQPIVCWRTRGSVIAAGSSWLNVTSADKLCFRLRGDDLATLHHAIRHTLGTGCDTVFDAHRRAGDLVIGPEPGGSDYAIRTAGSWDDRRLVVGKFIVDDLAAWLAWCTTGAAVPGDGMEMLDVGRRGEETIVRLDIPKTGLFTVPLEHAHARALAGQLQHCAEHGIADPTLPFASRNGQNAIVMECAGGVCLVLTLNSDLPYLIDVYGQSHICSVPLRRSSFARLAALLEKNSGGFS